MIQYRFDKPGILGIMEGLGLSWIEDPWYDVSAEWDNNLARLIDALTLWCKASGLKNFAPGHTQIELCVTFSDPREAMLFKLRWQNVRKPEPI